MDEREIDTNDNRIANAEAEANEPGNASEVELKAEESLQEEVLEAAVESVETLSEEMAAAVAEAEEDVEAVESAEAAEDTVSEPVAEAEVDFMAEKSLQEEVPAAEETAVESVETLPDEPAAADTDIEEEAEEDVETVESVEAAEDAEDSEKAWYVIHTYSGYENKVKKNLEHRIESMNMQDHIYRVVVPTEDEIEIRDGQRRTVERRIFPGYVLVQMTLNDESWYVVRNTPGVTGFVSSGTRPVPLRKEEIEKIIKRMEAEEPTIKVSFHRGERVQITSGPFAEFMGTVDSINMSKGKATVLVSFFGRETPVEVELTQVSRL